MQNKDIVIIALVVLIIYLAYRQTQSKSLNIKPNSQELQDLKQQVIHYQTLYQKRVEKDLEIDQKIRELVKSNHELTADLSQVNEQSELLEQKIKDLEQDQEDRENFVTFLEQQLKKNEDKKAQELLEELKNEWREKERRWAESIVIWETREREWKKQEEKGFKAQSLLIQTAQRLIKEVDDWDKNFPGKEKVLDSLREITKDIPINSENSE